MCNIQNVMYLCMLNIRRYMIDNRYLLIINPVSGTWNKRGLAEAVQRRMSLSGVSVDTVFTSGAGDATRLAGQAVDAGYSAVIAAGGDGTINETATALCNTSIPLGIIPSGSGNGLARHLNIPVDPKLSLDVIAKGHVTDCDYGTVNDLPFFCTFGVGFDAAVSDAFARQKRRGKFMYVKSAFEQYVKYNPQVYTISANGNTLTEEAFIVVCCNASQYGNNAYIAPRADMTDGLLDITIVHAGTPLDTALVGVDLFTGYINRNTMIRSFRAPSAVISRSEDGPVHIDGEPLILGRDMDVKCHRSSLRIFTPDRTPEFRPIITPVRSFFMDVRSTLYRIFG